MINTKKVLLITLLIVIPLVALISSGYLIFFKQDSEVKGVTTKEKGCVPYIVNTIPRVAYVGEEYHFFPRVSGCQVEEIEVRGVGWLNVDSDMGISGIPKKEDIGTFKIEIYTRSSTDIYELKDYIIVKENEK